MNSGNNHINVQLGLFNSKWYMWYKDGTNDYIYKIVHKFLGILMGCIM